MVPETPAVSRTIKKKRIIEHREFYQPCRRGMATTTHYGRACFSRLKGPVGCPLSSPGPFFALAPIIGPATSLNHKGHKGSAKSTKTIDFGFRSLCPLRLLRAL